MDRYRTQWAAQFFAAAELTRRNYRVSLTLGNAPAVDLMVVSPKGAQFMVDVKGQASKNFWLIRERKHTEDLYYILAYVQCVPQALISPEFFIMSSAEVMRHIAGLREKTETSGKRWAPSGSGITWTTGLQYKDWGVLPS
jgi:hypothetical protein